LLKWPGCEDDHSPPSIAKVKNEGNCNSTLPVSFKAFAGTALLSMYFILRSGQGGSYIFQCIKNILITMISSE